MRTSPIRTISTTESPGRRPPAAGFTLIEVMVVLTIIGFAFTSVIYGGGTLLPQSRLKASARALAGRMEQARVHALLNQESLLFEYDLEKSRTEVFYPYERGEDGRRVGPGRTTLLLPMPLEGQIRIREIRLPESEPRLDGLVQVPISTGGRIVPHDVIIHNPDFPDTEVITLRFSGLAPTYELFDRIPEEEFIDDASFR